MLRLDVDHLNKHFLKCTPCVFMGNYGSQEALGTLRPDQR